MNKKIAIVQSNYIPWKGYFDMIASVDEFILYDDVQYTKNDWRNRNKIKTPNGTEWITIPTGSNIKRRICDVHIANNHWQIKHWKTITHNYSKARHFKEISKWLEPLYLEKDYVSLSETNKIFIQSICEYLDIKTIIINSSNFKLIDGKTDRIVHICSQVGATEYVTGPSAKNYIDESIFSNHNIKVTWFDYNDYPQYPQLWDNFTHEVSIIDLLFNCGKQSVNFLRHIKK